MIEFSLEVIEQVGATASIPKPAMLAISVTAKRPMEKQSQDA